MQKCTAREPALEFDDSEQPYAPRRAPAPRRRTPQPQQVMARRLVAAGVGIVILILLILGVKGCLDARKQRSLENYVSDTKSLVASTDQLSTDFFKILNDPSSTGQVSFSQALDNIAGGAEGLYQRAQQLSTPGDLQGAKADLVQAYELRRDGIRGFADALASGDKDAASLAVAHMKEILAGDVLYVHSKDQSDQVLADQGIDEQVPASVFMEEPTKWLDEASIEPLVASAGSTSTGASGSPCTPKGSTCGLGLVSASIGGVALSTSATTTVTGSSVDVSVQNQGDIEEAGVQVSASLGGASHPATIPKIAAGATKTVTVPLKPVPASGQTAKLQVDVTPVDGEHVTSNNKATYSVTFG